MPTVEYEAVISTVNHRLDKLSVVVATNVVGSLPTGDHRFIGVVGDRHPHRYAIVIAAQHVWLPNPLQKELPGGWVKLLISARFSGET